MKIRAHGAGQLETGGIIRRQLYLISINPARYDFFPLAAGILECSEQVLHPIGCQPGRYSARTLKPKVSHYDLKYLICRAKINLVTPYHC
jgi:hypothetical protein